MSVEPLSRKNRDPNLTQNEYVYAICCQLEEAGDPVISGENVKTTETYAALNFEAVSLAVSEKINISHLRNA